MLIGIDGNEANTRKRVGIGQYAFQLLVHLHRLQQRKADYREIKFCIYLKNPPLEDLPKEHKNWSYSIFGPKKLWTQFALPLHLSILKEKPDLFFSPSHYAPRFTQIPQIISVMDLSYLYYPQLFTKKDLFQLINWTRYSVKKAKKIFTISDYSKKAIIENYGTSADDVIVTYPGYDVNVFKEHIEKFESKLDILKEKNNITQNYFLFVGTIQPRKNISTLIDAFSTFIKKNPETQLVLVGKKGWLYESIFQAIENSEAKKNIRYLEFITDDELAVLYKGAVGFVLPSLYEGFGIPVVEAMACGCPTVVSNVTSLPEIASDASLLVDPQDKKSIVDSLEKLFKNPSIRKSLIQKGLIQAKKFNWSDCAAITMKVLTEFG